MFSFIFVNDDATCSVLGMFLSGTRNWVNGRHHTGSVVFSSKKKKMAKPRPPGGNRTEETLAVCS